MKKISLFALSFILLFISCACGEGPLPGDIGQEALFVPEDDAFLSLSIAASGTQVWRIAESEIICADAAAGQDTAALSIDGLLSTQASILLQDKPYSLHYAGLCARDENSVWLCTALTDEEDGLRILLLSLTAAGNRISVDSVTDAGVLSPFFSDTEWLEIDLTGCGSGQILIAALDQEHVFHLFSYHPADGTLTDLGTEPLMFYQAAIPYGPDILLAGISTDEENALDLTLLPLSGAERRPLTTIGIDSDPFNTANFAWSPEDNLLYYTLRNSAYRADPETEEPSVPFAVTGQAPALNRLGVIAGGKYILYAEDGTLLCQDLHAELSAARIRIADCTGNETLPDIAASFNSEQDDYYITVSSCDEESLILPEDYDIFVSSADSGLWTDLKNRYFLSDLSGNEILRSAVADMPGRIQSLVYSSQALSGIPVHTESTCLALNIPALQSLSGLSREELPTDWPGFLHLMNHLAAGNILAQNPQYILSDISYTADELKEMLFAWLINDSLLQIKYSGASIDTLPAVLLPALREFSSVPWDNLGLPEEDPEMLSDGKKTPLLTAVQPEIAVMSMEDGMEYWPLSIAPEGERLISQTVSVMSVNPGSSLAEGALAFMEYAWNNLDILDKMSLSASMNEPVENPSYDEDIAYLEMLVSSYQDSIINAETDEEAASLREELDELEDFLTDYRENAFWLASRESIGNYRALSVQLIPDPAVPEFLNDTDEIQQQFLEGAISPDQFAAALEMILAGNS